MAANGDLSPPEEAVRRAAAKGELVDLRTGVPGRDDPTRGATWTTDRTVRAELLVDLLTAAQQPDTGRPRAVRLRGARITGSLDLEAATLTCPLLLRDCYIEQLINLNEAAASTVRLPGCYTVGIAASQLRTTGAVELNQGFAAHRGVTLIGAHIGGILSLNGATLSNDEGPALQATRLTVDQTMFCRNGFTAHGEVVLLGARIHGALTFESASLSNNDGLALQAARLHVGQSLSFEDGFTARGEICLVGARVGDILSFQGARLSNDRGPALQAARLTVEQSMFCNDGFTADGEVNLLNAHIYKALVFNGAHLHTPDGKALFGSGLTVDQALSFGDGFVAHGEVNLFNARIGGRVDLREARLTNPGGTVLDLENARATGLRLLPAHRLDGVVDLTNARVGNFHDDSATWPTTLLLRGFVYETLDGSSITVRQRLQWLSRNPEGYLPQLYEQLATVYQRTGHEEAARQVRIAKQRRRSRELNITGRLWNWLLYLTVGYGYRTWQAAVWLSMLLAAGSAAFDRAYPSHMKPATTPAPEFHPIAYTLDVLLPIVDLGQEKAWLAQRPALYCTWALTGAGWVLTTAVVAGLTSVLKRQ